MPPDPRKRELVLRWVRDLGLEGHAGFTAEGLTDNFLEYLYRNGAGVYIAKVRDAVAVTKEEYRNSSGVAGATQRPDAETVRANGRALFRNIIDPDGEPSPSWFDDAALGPDVETARKSKGGQDG